MSDVYKNLKKEKYSRMKIIIVLFQWKFVVYEKFLKISN